MKFLLISPIPEQGERDTFPLGLAYVSACLKRAGHSTVCIDAQMVPSAEDAIRTAIAEHAPDAIGVGGISPSFVQIRRFLQLARDLKPGIICIGGGGVVSADPEFAMQHLPLDVGVIGEGEETVVELARHLEQGLPLDGIHGLALRRPDGTVHKTPARAANKALDDLPWPDYEGFGFERYVQKRGGYGEMISSRSCPYACTFCWSALGRVYRTRSVDKFMEELVFLATRYGVKHFGVYDELFTVKKERMVDFCNKVKQYGVTWWTQLRIDSLDEEMLDLMKEAGCTCISLGLESMSLPVLTSMRKKITPPQIEAALELIYSKNIAIFGNFIFGDPAETWETANETLNWWLRNPKHAINMGMVRFYPGSRIYEDAAARGRIYDKLGFHERGCPEFNGTTMPNEQYQELREKIPFYLLSCLYPGDLVAHRNYTEMRDGKAVSVHDFTCICPHCNQQAEFLGITRDSITFERHNIYRPYCPHCQHRFDVPVLLPASGPSAEDEALLDRAEAEWRAGRAKDAVTLVDSVLSKGGNARAYFIKGQILLSENDVAGGRHNLRHALRNNPAAAHYHAAYADHLRATNEPEEAAIFAALAGRLRQAQQPVGMC